MTGRPASLEGPAFAGEPTHAAGLELSTLRPAAYWVPLEVVKRWSKNPRDNEKAVPGVVASLKRFGWGAPMLARVEDGELIAGDTRIQGAEVVNAEDAAEGRTPRFIQVPVRFMTLAAAEAFLLALADNRVGENAEWNDQKLSAVLEEVLAEVPDEDFAGVGFTDDELSELLAEADDEGDRPANAGDGAAKLGSDLTYQVVVTCDDEGHQSRLMAELEQRNLKCRPLIL